MKKLLFIFSLLIALCANSQIDKVIPDRPNPPRLVNDLTHTLTAAQAEELERKLVAYDDSTSNQIAVVIIPTTGDYDVQEVALEIMRNWGVGGKEHNNGIVLLVAMNDHKLRIETGYGLEGAIPDITAKRIIDNEITPSFKEENYYRGLDKGTDAIIKAAAGEYKAPANYRDKKKIPSFFKTIVIIIIIIIFLIGSGGSRGNGTFVSRRGYGGMGSFWLGTLLGSLGGRSGGGGWSGGGGGWSGGGGGFGGFGGGSGGGGGASGSW